MAGGAELLGGGSSGGGAAFDGGMVEASGGVETGFTGTSLPGSAGGAETSRLGSASWFTARGGGASIPPTGGNGGGGDVSAFAFGAGSSALTTTTSPSGIGFGAGDAVSRSGSGGIAGNPSSLRTSGTGAGAFLPFVVSTGSGTGKSGGDGGVSTTATIFGLSLLSITGLDELPSAMIGVGGSGGSMVMGVESAAAWERLLKRAPRKTPAQQSTHAAVSNPIWVLRVTGKVPP
jgi:hypothetical protein